VRWSVGELGCESTGVLEYCRVGAAGVKREARQSVRASGQEQKTKAEDERAGWKRVAAHGSPRRTRRRHEGHEGGRDCAGGKYSARRVQPVLHLACGLQRRTPRGATRPTPIRKRGQATAGATERTPRRGVPTGETTAGGAPALQTIARAACRQTPLSGIDIIAGRGEPGVVGSCRFFERSRQSHGRQFCDLGTTWSRLVRLGFDKCVGRRLVA
jgi:hypothetical protein